MPRLTYWQRTRRLTMALLFVWSFLTFGVNWYADELNQFVFLGFPLGFYLAAQGELLVFLLIIWGYNRKMKSLDAEFGINDE